jgi:hypothetical protein
MRMANYSFHADHFAARDPRRSQNRITMQAFAGYEHAANKINQDKCDPNDADCPLWNELSPLYRIYKR